ncbi:prepilin-type N-terminal cleavage/methylation domain-containing protein [Cellulomonas dongxiuzhuiae]|uniref:Prepilin-type N-terminal cleavage/methylation domain-containing protein n=1 Tax=Cellulomonas dongxiuzhuiae TaxID=2819979 RepID=A0ABX8GEG9_9CELL|nr:prepilin-type N-terminal cleavage/methylation domain-containing protein [Cellulomonas dongxiuzhuiae]MBO3087207.1 prepilin-type N-terminal cleavage/methylation domain-containing protein [Cellulomonas dongxiuzhuiae]MBO3090122.1 prepilin-type N-terminal cleavage/methylation domain-containing protein [Cellulomonas dongxiuzhuiae]MBO3093396.1 prepilin-type N-terminal cleavage/methylation domain-containing protein [Cellulomonas dongxiuzhuiae]QWC14543.1 prepilin-type N-terminal cleavage/methylation 
MVQRQTTRGAHADDGMSLVEVLIAAVVLAILSTAVLGVILRTQAANVDTRSRTAAASLAQREIEFVREEFVRTPTSPVDIANAGVVTNAHPLTGGTAGSPLVLDNVPYTVTRSVAWNVTGTGASACEGGSLVQHPTLGVTVAVTWPNMGATRPVLSHIQLAPPKGTSVSATQGFVAVKVVDSDGAPHAGRTVRVTSTAGATTSSLTDTAGCAVVAVNPPAAGSVYTARLGDVGFVDVSGVPDPSKQTGVLKAGQLNANLSFAYDRAATLRVRVVDGSGALLPDSAAAGALLTVAATVSSGSSATSEHTATGSETTIGGLWPSRYGAYFGAAPPPGGYASVELEPGATGQVDVVLKFAEGTIGNLPPGTTGVVAVPGTGGCTAPGARSVDPAGFSLMPGQWTFWATGAAFTCATGPTVTLVGGPAGTIGFAPSVLRVVGVPAGGTLWAVSTTKATGLTTCAGAATAGVALNVDAARTGPLPLPAGDWFVYRTNGAADGPCLSVPATAYPQNVAYGTSSTLTWVDRPPPVGLTITNVPSGNQWRVFVSRTTRSANCGTTLPAGAVQVGALNARNVTGSVEQGVWYVYRQRTDGNTSTRCTLMKGPGTVTISGTATAYSADFMSGLVTSS